MTADQRLIAADERAREEALDVRRSFIVQAPAGSGKTELLIQRYLKLLAIVDHPEEVLAITFTRKAAAEMQLRVLDALRRAQRGEEPREAHERVTSSAACKVLERDRQSDWNIVANPRRLRIQTLDSLNAMIARARPLTSAGGITGSSIVADAEMKALYRSAAALTFDQLTETDDHRDATEMVLRHVDNNTDMYLKYLARMLATRDQWLPFIGSGQLDDDESRALRRQFEASLEKVAQSHLDKLFAAFPPQVLEALESVAAYACIQLEGAGLADSPITGLHGDALLATTVSMAAWLGVAELLLTGQGEWRKQVNKNQGFPPGDDGQKAVMLDVLESVANDKALRDLLVGLRSLPPAEYDDEQWQVMLALFRLLPLTVMELKRLFAEQGISDHIEIALSAAEALGTAEEPGDVALLLDYQIRHLLVDEMQDTSSAQYRMLEALTGGWTDGDGRTLFCVGDPMQSIYRFRNAEVGQFLLAQQAGIGEIKLKVLTLRRNFRSGENLVNWFNEVFPGVFAAADDPQQSAVSYSAAVSVPNLEGIGCCTVHPLYDSQMADEADKGLSVIATTLDSNPDDDMAILVRSRTHLPMLLYRLRRAGIPYRAIEIDRLTDLPEIIDILALTRAMVHLGDRLAWLALLRSPWVGLDWTDLHALVRNDTGSSVWELLHDAERVSALSDKGQGLVAEFIRQSSRLVADSRCDTLRDRVESAWLHLGGPAILRDAETVQNIYRFLDVIAKIERSGTLQDVAELEAALDQEHVSSDAESRLQVMTMHRAKGLQFDHVLLYGLGHVPRPPDHGVLSWIDIPDIDGTTSKIVSPVGPRADVDKDPLHRYIASMDARKDKNELGRLLYVACTRARKSLHLLGHARTLKRGLSADRRSLLHLLWPVVSAEYERARSAEDDSPEYGDTGWLLPVLRRIDPPWNVPDVPSLPGPEAAGATSSDTTAVDFYWVGAGARFAGTIVHRWIQMATEGLVKLEQAELPQLRATSERWILEMGVSSEMVEAIANRIEDALRGLAADNRGRWLLAGDGHAEFALRGILNGKLESVIIDRIRIDDDGTHWIVDYKTSSHEGGNLAAFLDAEVERYRAQLAKYAALYRNYSGAEVRCALYFPLLQEFVEVPA